MYRKKFIKNFPYITKYPVKELLDINISDNTSPEFGHETSQRPLKDALKKPSAKHGRFSLLDLIRDT